MDLDFFNNLSNNIKENKIIQSFLKDLENFLEKNENKNLSYIEIIQNQKGLMPKYRDNLYLIRNDLLCDYSNKEDLYFIYGKNPKNGNYIANVYRNGNVSRQY